VEVRICFDKWSSSLDSLDQRTKPKINFFRRLRNEGRKVGAGQQEEKGRQAEDVTEITFRRSSLEGSFSINIFMTFRLTFATCYPNRTRQEDMANSIELCTRRAWIQKERIKKLKTSPAAVALVFLQFIFHRRAAVVGSAWEGRDERLGGVNMQVQPNSSLPWIKLSFALSRRIR